MNTQTIAIHPGRGSAPLGVALGFTVTLFAVGSLAQDVEPAGSAAAALESDSATRALIDEDAAANADGVLPDAAVPTQVCTEGACTLTYQFAFFQRYAPVTALDMVNNLPGFRLQNGDTGTRGFGGAAGNVIINGARISAKSETPEDILGRIPAADVMRIEVIRGQVGGLDLRGQNVVANVIRVGDSSSGAWTLGATTYDPDGGFYPSGDLSYSMSPEAGQLTVALSGREFKSMTARRERVLDGEGNPSEARFEFSDEDREEYRFAMNGSTDIGDTRLAVNLARAYSLRDGGESSRRYPTDEASPFLLFQGNFDRSIRSEFGFDAERPLSQNWRGKIIGLYRDEDSTREGSLVRGPLGQIGVTEVETETRSLTEELIGRLELDYAGFDGHTIEINLEATNNTLASDFFLKSLEDGELVDQPVPGGQTEVEEERFDLLVSDSFRIGELSIDAALGAEDSTITQIGGFNEARSFFFWKPSLAMSFSPNEQSQWRFRALRNVGQLDLQDFASGADLGDVELALGNPQLSPATTTTADISFEKRGEGFGIGTVTVFHDWIEDVNDLLPLSGNLEVPGNIGSATRIGIRGALTLPLDVIGLSNGRMDARAIWRDSRVDDPLTGLVRRLSDERQWGARVAIRQDLQAQKLAWGVEMFTRDWVPQYGLDEIDFQGKRADMDVFVESRAIQGLRVRLTIEDLLRDGEERDRRVYAGDRSVEPLAFRELRQNSMARTVTLEVRGDF